MPIIKFVNEDDKVEYKTEDVVKTLLYYAFNPEKTKAYGCQFVGCKPFLFQKEYSKNPFVVHKFMEFNHRRQYKHQRNLAKHRVVSFGLQECIQPCSLRSLAENIVSFYANKGYIAAYAIHFSKNNPHIHIIVDAISYQDLNLMSMGTSYEYSHISSLVNEWMFYHGPACYRYLMNRGYKNG